jgi:heat shock protein HslJ
LRLTALAAGLAAGVGALLAGCGPSGADTLGRPGTTSSAAGPALEETSWELGPQALDLPGPDDARPTLRLEGGTATGSSGCNTYRAPYTLATPSLTFGPAASTRMACGAAQTAIETAYLDRLSRVAAYELAAPGLVLRDSGGATVLTFAAADTSLEGAWTVTGYLAGSGPAASELTADFGADGVVGGNAGCNTYGGPWTASDDGAITIGPLAVTLMACADQALSAQETSFLQALESSVSAEVAGRRATFTNEADQVTVTLSR